MSCMINAWPSGHGISAIHSMVIGVDRMIVFFGTELGCVGGTFRDFVPVYRIPQSLISHFA